MTRILVPCLAVLGAALLSACASDDPAGGAPGLGGDQAEVLAPPAEGKGVQLRMVSAVAPGQEIERCQLIVAPPGGLAITDQEVRFTQGSHHMLLYSTQYKEIPKQTERKVALDASQPHDCPDGAAADWAVTGVVGGSQSSSGDNLVGKLPDGVALIVEPGTVLVMNTHYLNASSEPLEADARINLYTVPREDVKIEAGVLFYYNPFIRVPANGASTARMRCPVNKDISLVAVQSHMHRRGVGFVADLTDRDGNKLEELYTNTAWEQVPTRRFDPVLQIEAGQAIDYQCEYENSEARDVDQGLRIKDEMCMLIGPYFPVDRNLEQCLTDDGVVGSTWIGDGAATCGETLGCMRGAKTDGAWYGCVVDSCPAAGEGISELIRCQVRASRNECAEACASDGAACGMCIGSACQAKLDSCMASACE